MAAKATIMYNNEVDQKNENINNVKLTLPPSNEEHRSSNSSLDQETRELSKEEKEKILEQAEFYFSDENLRKDGFLLKHVKRNKEGYVNLKLVASFKKMRSLCKDFNVIADILKASSKLELNDTGLKIKRKEPLSKELFETLPVRSVVVSKISNPNPSMDFIAEAFGDLKEKITSLRIVKQGKNYPHDLQSHFARHPELTNEVAAVVEFEDTTAASQAMKFDFSSNPMYNGLYVAILEMGPKQGKKKKKKDYGDLEAVSAASDDSFASTEDTMINTRKKKKDRFSELARRETDDSSSYASSSDGEQQQPSFQHFKSCGKRFERMHPGSNASSTSNSPMSSPQPSRRPNQLDVNDPRGSSPALSPKHSRSNSPLTRSLTPEGSPLQVMTKLSPLVTSAVANSSASPQSSPEGRKKRKSKNSMEQSSESSPSSGQSDWMRRRMMAHAEKSEINKLAVGMRHLEILRQPRGPDGSSGFGTHPMNKFVTINQAQVSCTA